MDLFPKQDQKELVSKSEEVIVDYWKDNIFFKKQLKLEVKVIVFVFLMDLLLQQELLIMDIF